MRGCGLGGVRLHKGSDMSDRILPGDLVVVIAGCCANDNIGLMFIAGAFGPNRLGQCCACGKIYDEPRLLYRTGRYYPLSRLKKINPPAVKTDTTTELEVSS